MANQFVVRTSVHGRRLGISSSGGLVLGPRGAEDVSQSAEMWGSGLITTSTALVNEGVNVLTGTGGAQAFTLSGAPAPGVKVEIWSDSSSSTITIDTTATTINFNSSGGTSSTRITFAVAGAAGATRGEHVVIRGYTSTRWQVISKSGGVS